jgi:hypothetical protein
MGSSVATTGYANRLFYRGCSGRNKAAYLCFFLVLGIILSGCAIRPILLAPESTQIPPYKPPTLVPLPTHTSVPTQKSIVLTPQVACEDNLSFKNDLTIPDGTVVVPSSTIDKRWEVVNSGTCNWNEQYRLRQTAGPDLGLPKNQGLYPARSGSQAVIRIVLTAPTKTDKYHIVFQAANPEGQLFGDPIYMDIQVSNP